MTRKRIPAAVTAAVTALSAFWIHPASAAERSAIIEEVIVTAQKREEAAQDVPLPITALSQELQQASIRSLTDLNGFAPNVNIARDPSRAGGSSITIRGISPTRTDDNSFDSPIAVMIDGIYLGTLAGQVLENFDLERVEVLRGPQGTLFGKNTVGGVINVIRSRPTGELGARLNLTVGEWGQQEFRGVFNTPVIEDKLAAKFFYTNLQGDGYIENEFAGGDMPEKDYQNYGLTLLANPTDSFEALFTIEKFEDDSQGGANLTNFNLAPGVVPPPTDPREQDLSNGFLSCTLFASMAIPNWNSDVPCRTSLDEPSKISTDLKNPSELDTDAYTLTMSWDVSEALRLVSVTGYRDMVENRQLDFDGSSGDFITIERRNDFDQFSQELRVEGAWDNFTVVAGGYYWDSEFTQDWVTGGEFWSYINSLSGYDLSNNTWIFGGALVPPGGGEALALGMGLTPLEGCLAEMFGNVRCDTRTPVTGMGPGLIQELWETQRTKSTAVFAQADWTFAEDWTLTAGIRYTTEEKDFQAGQAYLAPVENSFSRNFPAIADLDNDWNDTSPKLGLAYRMTPDVMFYASYSEGFHSGGFFGVNQNVADFERDQYDPEYSKNWELGMKSQLFEDRVQLNLAYFYNDFEDKQEQSIQFDASTNTVATVFSNAASVIYQGIEVETQWAVTNYLRLFASFGWLDAEYDEFETDINPNDDAIGGPTIEDASFLTPRNAPEYTYGLGGDLSIPVGAGFFEAFAKYAYTDDVETNLLNLQVGHIDSREDLSASVGYRYQNFQITVFGRNLTDEVIEVPTLIQPLFASGTISPGRSWGVELLAEF